MSRIGHIVLVVVLGLASGIAQAQEPAAGQLLFASPTVDDPNFERTVLLIIHHDDDGTLALALNRPTWVDPAEAFPELTSLAGYGGELFLGGPNSPDQPLLLFENSSLAPLNARRVMGSVFVTTDMSLLADLQQPATTATGQTETRVRLYAGHAAWIPGQLEQEIASGTWDLAPARADQVFAADPTQLWERQPSATNAVTAALR